MQLCATNNATLSPPCDMSYSHRVFIGLVRSTELCYECGIINVTYEEVVDIGLSIPEGVGSVDATMAHYVAPEYTPYNRCNCCGKVVSARKTLARHDAP